MFISSYSIKKVNSHDNLREQFSSNMRLLRVPLRYNVCNRRIIDTYRWHDRRTFYMSPVLLKCHQTRGCVVLVREEIPAVADFPTVRDFDRWTTERDFRAMYDVEISENTLNVKQNASLPVRGSLSTAASKPWRFQYLKLVSNCMVAYSQSRVCLRSSAGYGPTVSSGGLQTVKN